MERNNKENKPGTTVPRSVPPISQSSIACGTSVEGSCKAKTGNSLDGFQEDLAIAKYDGQQTSTQVEWSANMDAFVSLPYDDPKGDWLSYRINVTKEWLVNQGIVQQK